MRILIVNRAMGTMFGGGESFDRDAARFLSKAGHEVRILCGKPLIGPPRHVFPDLNIDYLSVPNIRRIAYITEKINKLSAAFYRLDLALFEQRASRWLATSRRYREYDVIQVCGLFGLAEHIVKHWRIPTIAWLPGIPSRRPRRSMLELAQIPGVSIFSHGDTIRFAREQMGLDRIAAIGPGLDLDAIAHSADATRTVRARLDIPEDAPLGATVARLVPIKNLEFLLEGLNGAMRRVPTLHHLVVGEGPLLPALVRKRRSLGLENSVHFVGQRSSEEVSAILAACDFFALTSTYESFSIATLEALAHALPIIGTKVGYLQNIVRDSGAGVAVPPGDVSALEDAIVDMAVDSARRREFSEHAQRYVAQFAWPTVAEQLAALYEDTRRRAQVG